MPKGKKFTAAEKHFEEKRKAMQSQFDQLKKDYVENYKSLVQARDEVNILKAENERLKDWIERLLEYTNLSEEDIRQVCEAEKRRGEALHTFTSLMKMTNMFGY